MRQQARAKKRVNGKRKEKNGNVSKYNANEQ